MEGGMVVGRGRASLESELLQSRHRRCKDAGEGHASLQPGLLQSRRCQCKDAGEGGRGWIHAMMEPGQGHDEFHGRETYAGAGAWGCGNLATVNGRMREKGVEL
jgi:hypothetical protein